MHTVLILSGGRSVEALILAASADRMRVAIPGRSDTMEFRLVDGGWTSDRGLRAEIGALVVPEGMGEARFLPRTQSRTFSAV